MACSTLRLRRLQEGAGRWWLHGTERSPILLGVLRRPVRGSLRRLCQAHRGQGHYRVGRQVAPRLLHLQ